MDKTTEFYMVWREGGHRPRHKHVTLEAAQNEAQRVAERHPGYHTYVLKAIEGYAIPASPVVANRFELTESSNDEYTEEIQKEAKRRQLDEIAVEVLATDIAAMQEAHEEEVRAMQSKAYTDELAQEAALREELPV